MEDNLSPGYFHGGSDENPKQWWQGVLNWVAFRKLTDGVAKAEIALLLKDGALLWYETLPDEDKANMTRLGAAFDAHYITSQKFQASSRSRSPYEPSRVHFIDRSQSPASGHTSIQSNFSVYSRDDNQPERRQRGEGWYREDRRPQGDQKCDRCGHLGHINRFCEGITTNDRQQQQLTEAEESRLNGKSSGSKVNNEVKMSTLTLVESLSKEVEKLRVELEANKLAICLVNEREKQIRDRLSELAQRQLEKDTTKREDILMDDNRPTQLIQRYSEVTLHQQQQLNTSQNNGCMSSSRCHGLPQLTPGTVRELQSLQMFETLMETCGDSMWTKLIMVSLPGAINERLITAFDEQALRKPQMVCAHMKGLTAMAFMANHPTLCSEEVPTVLKIQDDFICESVEVTTVEQIKDIFSRWRIKVNSN